jgi:hypothetical protein
VTDTIMQQPSPDEMLAIDAACDAFELLWQKGRRPAIESHLGAVPPALNQLLLGELIRIEMERRFRAGETPTAEEYRARFPRCSESLETWLVEASAAAKAVLAVMNPDQIYEEFEAAWEEAGAAPGPRIEEFLTRAAPQEQIRLLSELLRVEIIHRVARGEAPTFLDYCQRFPNLTRRFFTACLPPSVLAMEDNWPSIPEYEIEASIGRGGMGVVYRARHRSEGAVRAIKMILRAGATFHELVRFRIEAEALACLDHTNIVQIVDVGVWAGYPYLALEYAEQGSLRGSLQKAVGHLFSRDFRHN